MNGVAQTIKKEGRKSVAPSRRKFAVRGFRGRGEGRGGGRDERRYDLIKGSLLLSRDFLSWPINESNFSSDFRLLRGFSRLNLIMQLLQRDGRRREGRGYHVR